MLLTPSESAAETLQRIVNSLLDTGQLLATAQIAAQMESDDLIQQAAGQYSQRITKRMFELLRPARQGRTLRIDRAGAGNAQVATIGVLVALLLPAVQSAREAA